MDWDTILRLSALILVVILLIWGRKGGVKHAFAGALTHASKTEIGLFCDVAANAEAKRSLEGLVAYLRSPETYEKLGARMPRGVLLYGPPGTGKTLLARSLAGEANVPFYSMSGSDFVEMYAGVGASRVRSLFQKARKAKRAVIFIDEIDCLGKKRGGEMSDERDQTLNALLSEMSGFRKNETILVVAATNRPDSLDPALLRPGRFDRRIEVGLPDREQRLQILSLHAANKPLAADVDLSAVAADTVRFSGAALECLLNEAAILAAERGGARIDRQDIQRAYREAVAGADKESMGADREELAKVAAHEAGHALSSRLLAPEKRIMRVSILPTSRGAAGYNLAVGEEKRLWTSAQFLAEMDILLAGRAAEQVLFGPDGITSGASDDLSRAADLAASMTADLAMGAEKAVHLRALSRDLGVSPEGALARCRELLETRYGMTVSMLEANREMLMRLTSRLLAEETLEGAEVDECLRGDYSEIH